jgi:NhaP-type Na+/H+ or K+/H+ antiporter
MALGGMCVGIAFGLGMLLVLYLLDRRFSREENIVEVTATAAVAYVGYYVAEVRDRSVLCKLPFCCDCC